MPVSSDFPQWLNRVRQGDPVASSELVGSFTPVVRRVVRVRLAHHRLSRLVDPLDVCQAVFSNFFARVSVGWPPVESGEQLTALLLTIARNKIRDEARRHTAVRRDHRRLVPGRSADQFHQLVARGPSPSQEVVWKELYDQVMCHLAEDERALLEDRLAGRTWAAIAADQGFPAEQLRQKLNRAVRRVRDQLTRANSVNGPPPTTPESPPAPERTPHAHPPRPRP